jgi:hypothetical protein
MKEIIKEASRVSREKLADIGTYGHLRPKSKKKRRLPKLKGKATAIIMPEEATPDFWSSPVGSYMRGGTLGAGTATGLGWAGGGIHWSGKTPWGVTRKGKVKHYKEVLKASQNKPYGAMLRSKWGRRARLMAAGGAAAGVGATAYYRRKAKKRKKELAKMPKQLTIKLPAKFKAAAELKPMKPMAPKLDTKAGTNFAKASLPPTKAPGKTQVQQSTKITTATVNKAASDKALSILTKIGSSHA